jgi:hypothetical protein
MLSVQSHLNISCIVYIDCAPSISVFWEKLYVEDTASLSNLKDFGRMINPARFVPLRVEEGQTAAA